MRLERTKLHPKRDDQRFEFRHRAEIREHEIEFLIRKRICTLEAGASLSMKSIKLEEQENNREACKYCKYRRKMLICAVQQFRRFTSIGLMLLFEQFFISNL